MGSGQALRAFRDHYRRPSPSSAELLNRPGMIPWEEIDSAAIAGGEKLRLKRRGAEFVIMSGATELMNSRLGGSEEALARLAAERIRDRSRARVLIGGLGLGFTLRAALAEFGSETEIVVAELVPAVVAWARGPLAPVFGDSLADERVTIREEDVAATIAASRGAWDAILLDVDNGPDGLTSADNDAIYGMRGLAAAHRALKPGGVLAVWSAMPDRDFLRRLGSVGLAAEEARVRARGAGKGPGKGSRHVIFLGQKAGGKGGGRR